MAVIIDACGRSCPEPVILTKKALASGPDCAEVLVDNQTSVENVSRFARHAGYTVAVENDGAVFHLKMTKA